MGYEGGKLADLVQAVQASTPRAARSMAEKGGEYLVERARVHTPVDSGEVRDSWEQKETALERINAADTYTSGVESHHHVARWVEWGVDPHRIEPEKDTDPETPEALTTPEGPRAGADHPGFRGFHPVASAAAELDAKGEKILRPEVERWKAEVEAAARAKRGIQ